MGLICSKCSKTKNKRYKKDEEGNDSLLNSNLVNHGMSSIEMNKHYPNEIEGYAFFLLTYQDK